MMIFKCDEKWVKNCDKRIFRNNIIETILSIVLIISAVITNNTIIYIIAAIIILLLISGHYFSPKRKFFLDAYSVEVSENGLIFRSLNHSPIYLNWSDLGIDSKKKRDGIIESITLNYQEGAGNIELVGLENMEILNSMINEKIGDL